MIPPDCMISLKPGEEPFLAQCFLHGSTAAISEKKNGRNGKPIFICRPHGINADVANLVAFAIATARDDECLLTYMRQTICDTYSDPEVRLGVLRDVMRVVAFMKAAITINRVLPKYDRILDCREAA